MADLTLVTGGVRSGKSRYVIEHTQNEPCVFIATAEALDAEMAQRISDHKNERGSNYTTVEEPVELPNKIAHVESPCLVVDCLTVWLGNLFHYQKDVDLYSAELISALASYSGRALLVTNEVGLGLVPENPEARQYRDVLGKLNQNIAAVARNVVLCISGIPMIIK